MPRILVTWRTGACRGLLVPIPPAAAERLEQRCRVGVARGLCGDEVAAFLLILLLCDQQSEDAGAAELILALRQLQGLAGIRGRVGLCLERAGIRLQGPQRI